MKVISDFLLLMVLVLCLMGCSRQNPTAPQSPGEAHTDHDEGEVEYSPGKGISLGETAIQTMGISSQDVRSTALPDSGEGIAHIFRLPDEVSTSNYKKGHAYATCLIPEAEALSLTPGQAMSLIMENGSILPCLLQRKEGQLRETSGQVELIIDIPDAPPSLAMGTSSKVRWVQSGKPIEDVLVVPSDALLDTVKGPCVYVVNGGFYLRTPVTVRQTTEGGAEIVDGLFEGDTIVVRGVQQLYLAELQAVNGGKGCTDGH